MQEPRRMARRHMVARASALGRRCINMGTPTKGGVASYHGVARSAKTEMPRLQYVASLCATPPSGGVRIVFFALYPRVWGFESSLSSPTQVVRVAHSTPWLFYAASPYGKAPEFGQPCRSAGSPKTEAPGWGRKNSGRWWSGGAAEPLQCRKKISEPREPVATACLGEALAQTAKRRKTLIHRFLSPRFTGPKIIFLL